MKYLALLLALGSLSGRAAEPAPTGLMCQLLGHPQLARITDPQPKFSWIVNASGNDQVQTAWQIRVATGEALLEKPDQWDSGKVLSDASTAVPYAGTALRSDTPYVWQVRTWDKQGVASAWSQSQGWQTGQLRHPGAPVTDPDQRMTVARSPLQQTPVSPVALVDLGHGHYFADFGRDAYAALKLTLTAPPAGQTVTVHLGEALQSPHQINRKPGGSIRYHVAQVAAAAGTHTYGVPLTPRDARRMPEAIGPVMPFRYVEVENAPAPLDQAALVQFATHYPFDDQAARFVCSDPALVGVWELCRYSMKATSFCGVYVDGDRERTPYEADAYINALGHWCSDREFSLARYSHEVLILHPTWPTEWVFHSVLLAWADYMQTGDAGSLAEFYEDLKVKTLLRLERPDGLIGKPDPATFKQVLASVHEKTMRDIVDWPASERDGYQMSQVNTVVNAFHYRALVLMGRIAAVLAKPQDAALFQAAAARTARAINDTLFDSRIGLYVDGEGSTHSALHANMMPLAFGLVPPDRVAKVAAFVRSRGMACSVYGAQYLMEALYAAGQDQVAQALMTAPGDRSWSHMIDVGTTITLEAWDNKYKPNQDWNHAWGAAPANIIPRLLMGIEPLEPAFRKVRIRPQPGTLASAAMDLPTVRGTIHVDLESAPAKFVLHLQLPANITGQICLPKLGRDSLAVSVDGAPREGRAEGSFVVIEPIGSGTHTLTQTSD